MSYDFNADEIFQIAEQIERNGATFYRKMSESVSDEQMKKELLNLESMEKEHEKTFSSLRANLSAQERKQTVFDPEGEAALYLQALSDIRVFDKQAEKDFVIPSGSSEEEIIRKIFREAINLEKESIVFYIGMKELVPEALGKKRIDEIIKEEMGHIRLLSTKLF
ncbi:MAG TPA: ferritin family protein [Desulfobacteraceae bacterium]|nr:ferritin family protein [Desulfobacteraceae bacterium]HPJ68463.1 ferritin family protein [Desulfobacteraceae bacterium]HPQ28072.1 ferritin family protein [Desulfobacteraceae bacterium]